VTRSESEPSTGTEAFVRKDLESTVRQATAGRGPSCQWITEARLQELIDRISRVRARPTPTSLRTSLATRTRRDLRRGVRSSRAEPRNE
jgi:hypothetical protein